MIVFFGSIVVKRNAEMYLSSLKGKSMLKKKLYKGIYEGWKEKGSMVRAKELDTTTPCS